MIFSKQSIVEIALQEDIGNGDITTDAIVPKHSKSEAVIVSKDAGVIAGLKILKKIFMKAKIKAHVKDGDAIKANQHIAVITGNTRYLLSRERVAMNFLRHLSGIATETRKYVTAVRDRAVILDTRKTAPGLRKEEKYAVRAGGAKNHRFGLYDMVLIKDNHIRAAGSISNAVSLARKTRKKIEVEVETLSQLEEALNSNPDMIMLDNMSVRDIRNAVKRVKKTIPLEASGNITLKNVKKIADTGVEYISVGAITHSAKALDISMDFK